MIGITWCRFQNLNLLYYQENKNQKHKVKKYTPIILGGIPHCGPRGGEAGVAEGQVLGRDHPHRPPLHGRLHPRQRDRVPGLGRDCA